MEEIEKAYLVYFEIAIKTLPLLKPEELKALAEKSSSGAIPSKIDLLHELTIQLMLLIPTLIEAEIEQGRITKDGRPDKIDDNPIFGRGAPITI